MRHTLLLPRCLLPCLLLGASLFPTIGFGELNDALQQRWYVTEVIVFERLNISDNNTLEALASEEPGRQPRTLGSFVAGATPAIEYHAETQRMLRSSPVRPIPVEPPTLDFTIPALPEPTSPVTGADANRVALSPEQQQTELALQIQTKLTSAVAAYELALTQRSYRFEAGTSPRLANEVQRLQRSRNYRVLWRGHWLQPVPTRDAPLPLLLQVDELAGGRYRLEGSLGLTVSRYLHLQAKLWYHDPAFGRPPMAMSAEVSEPVPGQEASTNSLAAIAITEPQYMLLNASRRMRSGYLHYLDHPKLGLLVRVDPVEHPAELLALAAAAERAQQ